MPSPPLVVPNAVQVRLVSGIAGQTAVNVLHGRKTSGGTIGQALAAALGAAIKTAYSTHLSPIISSGSGLFTVGIRDLTTANQPEYLDGTPAVVGADAGDQMPPYAAICVSLKTALSGKSFRGRVYLGGFTETVNAGNGTCTAAATDAAVAFIAAVQAAMATNGLTMGVLSRPAYAYQDVRTWSLPEGSERVEVLGNGLAKTGGISDVILIQSRNAEWETQRRRNNARGNTGALLAQARPAVFVGPKED